MVVTKVYKIGNMGIDDLTGLSIISVVTPLAVLASAAVNNFKNGGSNYQVTAGKTLTITGINVAEDSKWQTNTYLTLIYADDAALTTNVVNICTIPPGGVAGNRSVPIAGYTVPAAKYLGIANLSGAGITAYFSVTAIGVEA